MKKYVYHYTATDTSGFKVDGILKLNKMIEDINDYREIKDHTAKSFGLEREGLVIDTLSVLHEIEK